MNRILLSLLVVGVFYCQACVDLVNPKTGVSDCAARAYLCNDATYFSTMTTQCPRTCGRCPGVGACVDKVNPNTGISDCPATRYLCNDPAYFSFMTTQCPKTCGRCAG